MFVSVINAQTIVLQPFASGFNAPVAMAHAGDERMFVVQQGGLIRIVAPDGSIAATPFLNISSLVVSGGERGLLGLAFHPQYETNGYFYVNYTRSGDGATVIARYTRSASNPDLADNASAQILMVIPQPFSNHNGGSLAFGPDGYLYIGTGDGGSGGDPGNRSQNINDNLGKMLRIDVDGAAPYTNPATNPFVGVAGNDEIWATGLRNPWKFSFDTLTGDLWIADVGQNALEEINRVLFPLPAGLNFGWRCYEGNQVYNNSGCPPASALEMPFAQYNHSGGRCSITGGYVYRGATYPNFTGLYFFADFCSGQIGTVDQTGTMTFASGLPSGSVMTFGQDASGELYVQKGTAIYKITDADLSTPTASVNSVSLSPNPNAGTFALSGENMRFPAQLQIFDVSGKLVNEQTVNSTDNLQHNLKTGLYLLTVSDEAAKTFSAKMAVK